MARLLVAASSAAVLVLEILASRLLAPYVGVSHETFTGIIGVVLAGIATGAWAGGKLADGRDPKMLLGMVLIVGGVLAWMVLPILNFLGPQLRGAGVVAVLLLGLFSLFLPAAVLSAVTPMVAKLRLADLGETGAVVGGLSAAGTVGALFGTFVTGFVLIAALPTRLTVMVLGLALVIGGIFIDRRLARAIPTSTLAILALAGGLLGATSRQPCEHETSYYCVELVADTENASAQSLYLDGVRHAYVDLDDATNLDVRYVRLFAQASDALPAGPLDTLHIGGGGFSFPRYLQTERPGGSDLVLEIDPVLVELAEDQLDLRETDSLQVQVGDGRLALGAMPQDAFDLVIGDAFGSRSVPWHLTTEEFLTDIDRVLSGEGLYVMNVIDGGDFGLVRAEVATLLEVFRAVQVIAPPGGIPLRGADNFVLVASQSPIPTLAIRAEDGRVLSESETAEFRAGAKPLRDDFAPVDQLID